MLVGGSRVSSGPRSMGNAARPSSSRAAETLSLILLDGDSSGETGFSGVTRMIDVTLTSGRQPRCPTVLTRDDFLRLNSGVKPLISPVWPTVLLR
ncbi:hypothetical protein EYF80_053320 [Liparis tanakae]|uniref:Uncharacterized protein n=1 Tax=Liparis tanakae TaxID=230148 RepID=A0A4Z2F6M7_9TELE|nr:hypothetical protein EYF80_053320 [Liparis tanakae]